MTVEELQALVVSMEKQDRDISRRLDRLTTQNTKFSARITAINNKNPQKYKRQKGHVTIQTPAEERQN